MLEWHQIHAFVKAGIKQKKIAEEISVHTSTISRELARNTAQRGITAGMYIADNAQRRTDERQHQKPKLIRFTTAMKDQAMRWLEHEKWSPELISMEGKRTGKCPISTVWIYQWIWQNKYGNRSTEKRYKRIYQHLKHGKRRRKQGYRKDSRGIIHDRIPIEKRPEVVEKRIRPDNIEVDFMLGKNHEGAILFMTNRATLHTKLHILKNRHSRVVIKVIIQKLKQLRYPMHTITFHNDKGFANHIRVTESLYITTCLPEPTPARIKAC